MLTRSNKELREAFVKAHLATEKAFGNGEVRSWLENQRTAQWPDDKRWKQYLERWMGMLATRVKQPLADLVKYAHPSDRAPFGRAEVSEEGGRHLESIRPLLQAFDRTAAHVYYTWSRGAVVVTGMGGFHLGPAMEGEKKLTAVDNLDTPEVVDAIYASWLRQTPKAEAARTFLCKLMEEVVTTISGQVATQFSLAVAVSADGLTLVPADAVLVLDGEQETCYMSNAFQFGDNPKIELSPEVRRMTRSESSAEEIRKMIREGGATQVLYIEEKPLGLGDMLHGVCGMTLFTRKEFCPEPLPEGGIDFTVLGQKLKRKRARQRNK